jgi:PAS domain S-box-containing protein
MDSTAIKSSSWEWMFRVLKIAAEHAGEGIIVVDSAGIIRFANSAAAKAHGYEWRTHLLGKDLLALHSAEQIDQQVKPFMESALRLGEFSGSLEHTRRDGTTFRTDTKMSRVRNEAGDDAGFIIFQKDTAELDEARAALAAVNEQFRRELARKAELEASAPAAKPAPKAFADRLTQPVRYRYSPDAGQGGETKPDNAAQPQAAAEGTDPYLELRKAAGGPLDTGKLAELAELLKRLG